jgi:hypothetical protein
MFFGDIYVTCGQYFYSGMEFYQYSFLCFCVYLVICCEVSSIVIVLVYCWVTNFVLICSSVGTFVVFIYRFSLLLFWFTVLSLLFYITIITTFILAYSSVGSFPLFCSLVAACYRSAFMQCAFCFTDTEKEFEMRKYQLTSISASYCILLCVEPGLFLLWHE